MIKKRETTNEKLDKMNAFDYFFEKTSLFDKQFLVGKEEITYNELYNSCLYTAKWIKSKVGDNKNIILLSVNNLFFIKAYLSIIKSGNICIPLDPGIEYENYRYIFELTKPDLVFITRDVEKRLGADSEKSIFPDTLPILHIKKRNSDNIDFDREKCAEIIFTSGSTGKPKGVMISHKNLISNTSSIVEYLNLTCDDRMLVVLPLYYCYGLSLLHTHLRVGGSILFNNSFIFLGAVMRDLLEYKCSGFAGVPSHFQILLRKSDSFRKTKFPGLKYVTQAGGKLASVLIDEFRESQPEVKFIVMYGQTEATARLSWLPPELYEKKKGSVGVGIPGVELKVINESGEEIIPGKIGEVIARGDNIMMGYFKDKNATLKAIRNGWLYTGDLGTVDKDKYVYLTARSNEIIKVRGKRINPKEIESVILKVAEVIDCSVEGLNNEIEGEMLKATVIINNNSNKHLDRDYFIKHCLKYLALYKVPKEYEIIHELTISASGKKLKKY